MGGAQGAEKRSEPAGHSGQLGQSRRAALRGLATAGAAGAAGALLGACGAAGGADSGAGAPQLTKSPVTVTAFVGIPDADAYALGGYEVDLASRYYGHPAGWAPEAGAALVRTAGRLLHYLAAP